MRIADDWGDSYRLIDVCNGERLEKWGEHRLIRPDPQIMWKGYGLSKCGAHYDARYVRGGSKDGEWRFNKKLPDMWNICYEKLGLTFRVKPTTFKHTGVFPEQAVNWDFYDEIIRGAIQETGREIRVLNLFAYTGGATLACLSAGASVCHVDAVKSIVEWAKVNAGLSKLADRPVRWIVDDAVKFLQREIRRGSRYDAIILDPPSYGRGTNGETWKIEDCIYDLLLMCEQVLSENPLFVLMNSYTTGLSPSAAEYLMHMTIGMEGNKIGRREIAVQASEIGLPVMASNLALPCGNTAIVRF
jgi:23S rRNA (cytosine1962-C5)-methyltransferase